MARLVDAGCEIVRVTVPTGADAEYHAGILRLHDVFSPLVQRAKALGVAMRIGTNHGSLSDRIMNRFGDSPEGMVESALEFVRICEDWDYRDLVLSMKSSNPAVVLDVYRLLARRMDALGMDYPLHLGVTEAGDGADGRIKSALGIGVLLEEGLGDTVRVSLTEDPVAEIPVAFALVAPFNAGVPAAAGAAREPVERYGRTRQKIAIGPRAIGGNETVLVEVPIRSSLRELDAVRRELDGEAGVRVPEETRAEIVSVNLDGVKDIDAVSRLRASMELVASRVALSVRIAPSLATALDATDWARLFDAAHRVHVTVDDTARYEPLLGLSASSRAAVLFEASSITRSADDVLGPAAALGGLLCQGLGDAIHVDAGTAGDARRMGFNILQAARVRMTKTEYISCPSCGRTLFDLEATTAAVKKRTSHLKGLKIAVMGCIVNGPGEMADADFGYVGWGDEKIALFVGRDMVAKDIPTGQAAERLVELIRANGKSIDP